MYGGTQSPCRDELCIDIPADREALAAVFLACARIWAARRSILLMLSLNVSRRWWPTSQ